jgi:putative Mg2+ transporter-C (MgtC) family protein
MLLPPPVTEWEIVGRLVIALGLGLIIGAQRTRAGGRVGLRTYALVSLGAATFVGVSILVAQQMIGFGDFDPLRVASQIVVGVGFLGTGVIFTQGSDVRGLTTAAGLWVSAAIGMATGYGLYTVAFATSLLVVFTLAILLRVEERYIRPTEPHPHA